MDVPELHRLVEYKFAPEPLIAVQGLANTYSFDEGDEEELLRGPEEARNWLVRTGLGAPEITVTPSQHRQLVEFRSVIRSLLDANRSGSESAADGTALAGFAAEHPVGLLAGRTGDLELDLSPARSVDGVISMLLGISLRAQLAGEWPRLKICASDECRWAFFDSSRNRGGTWCQMEGCGNKIKNRAYRERRARG